MASESVYETPLDPPSRARMASSLPQNVTFDFAMSAISNISIIRRRSNKIKHLFDVLRNLDLFLFPLCHAGNIL